MAEPIVECVPNFSEGRDPKKLRAITDAIESAGGVRLLNVEAGVDTHRTVVTFVGPPDAVAEAAFRGIARARELIDMSTHQGAHPRMGATDVCPFVPVAGVTMEECVAIARAVGERVGRELELPVYLYEAAASRPERRNLADVRKGEYEGLSRKLADPAWAPDFGPARFDARSGATIIGAREFLIAYNINLNSTDKQHATDIAFELRERGRVGRSGNTAPYYFRGKQKKFAAEAFPCGVCDLVAPTYDEARAHAEAAHGYDLDALLRQNDLSPPDLVGQKVYKPGTFKACKAIGWFVADYGRAQISINLTNYQVTPPHAVLEEARRLAGLRGLVATGSEVVGVIPYAALLESGRYYLRKQGKPLGLPAGDILRVGITGLGLTDVAPFDPAEKVLGLPTIPAGALVRLTVADFTDEVSRDTPAPGGGSIAALAGALGAALASMVANLTHGKEGTEARDDALARIAEEAQARKDALLRAVDEDTVAFNAFMDARKLPQSTPEEKALRKARMQEGLYQASLVPLHTAQASLGALRLCREAVELGNPNSMSDAAVGAQLAFAGVRGGAWNVAINCKDLEDPAAAAALRGQIGALLSEARELLAAVETYVDSRLG